jgi:glycosyltransferase involved in cell wall biosynthesis
MTDLNIVIPVYNEAENIKTAIDKIMAECVVPHTITVVYDMDEDTTVPVVRQMQQDMDNLFLLKNKYGRGVLNAIKTGLEETTTKYVVVTMADLSDPPSVINNMYEIAEKQNADIVCASRYMKGGKQIGGPFMKGLMSRVAGLTLRYLAGVPTHDATNSFKLYRASFLKQNRIESEGGFELGIELVAKAHINGYKIRQTPTIWTDRVAGKSNFKLLKWLPGYLKWYFYAFKKHLSLFLVLFI